MRLLLSPWVLLLLFFTINPAASAQSTNTQAPWKAADRLLESIGGKEVWAATRILYVKEKAYPAGLTYPVTAEFWRNLESPGYRSVIAGDSIQRESFWNTKEGWVVRNGVRENLTEEQLQGEIADWYQEPYVMYRKLATRDPSIRLQLTGERKLEIYATDDGRLLCWFKFDQAGNLLIWGNYYQGEISEHVYGPTRPLGNFKMPQWGTSTNGSWRFEYLEAKAVEDMRSK